MTPGLGEGFPQSDWADQLNRAGRAALRGAFPTDKFIFREELDTDKGEDASLELLSNGRALNLRGHIQLKSTNSAVSNQDGSISESVPVKNLRYLLNSICPMYILYVDSTRELRIAWAWDEANRIAQEAPHWQEQDTVTIRFTESVATALDAIASRIKAEAIAAQTVLRAGRTASGAYVQIGVDPETWEVTDSEAALMRVESQGIEMINLGRVHEVLKLAGLIPHAQSRRPKLKLVQAYAFGTVGSLLEAQGHLSVARLGRAELDDVDLKMLTFLEHSLDFQTGRIDASAFASLLGALAEDDQSGFGLALRLEAARRLTLSGDPQGRDHLRDAIKAVANLQQADASLRFQASYCQLLLRGMAFADAFADKFAVLQARVMMGIPYDPIAEAEELMPRAQAFEVAAESLKAAPSALTSPGFEADVISLVLLVRTIVLTNMTMGVAPRQEPAYPLILAEIARALEVYTDVGDMEGQLRIRMQRANIHALYGESALAVEEANDVLPIAEALGLAALEESAREVASGNDHASRIRASIYAAGLLDQDVAMAGTPDSQMQDWARHNQAVGSLPDECFPYLLGEVFALREGARTTAFWCGHFDLHQNLRHRQSPQTLYRAPLLWSGHCALLDIAGREDMTDVNAAIEHFKSQHCNECRFRSPRSGVAASS